MLNSGRTERKRLNHIANRKDIATTKRNWENGRKRQRKEGPLGRREKQQLQQTIKYRVGPIGNGRENEPVRVTQWEIIIVCIGRFVHIRNTSAEFGRVARVPCPPHYHKPRRRGPSVLPEGNFCILWGAMIDTWKNIVIYWKIISIL